MKRIWAALALLCALAGAVVYSGFLVRDTQNALLAELEQVGSLAESGDFTAARAAIGGMTDSFGEKEHRLALFIKRDYLTGIAQSLGSLAAYARPEHLQDLHCEIGKAKAQILMTGHLFFSLL